MLFEQISEAANFIKSRASVAIVLGSGLGALADELAKSPQSVSIAYEDIPHFSTSSTVGHAWRLVWATIDDKPVLLMQGRVHRYEGYTASQVVFPIRVLHALGVRNLVLTNAAGAIGDHIDAGDLMLISDHLNLTGDNPMVGPNDLRLGHRFFDMGEAYSSRLRLLAKNIAAKERHILKQGVYAGVLGPSYETPAEIRMLKTFGADAVGMSTVFETIAARHLGMQVLGISCATNKAAGISKTPLNHNEVTAAASQASHRFISLLMRILPAMIEG